jgi:hypothetical protein
MIRRNRSEGEEELLTAIGTLEKMDLQQFWKTSMKGQRSGILSRTVT